MNRIKNFVAEAGAYAAGVLLSCGPSQVFGLVKGAIDTVRLGILQAKISRIGQEIRSLEKSRGMGEKNVRVPKAGQEQLTQGIIQEAQRAQEGNLAQKRAKLTTYKSVKQEKVRDLKGDGLALLPLAGAILSWRVYKKDFFVHSREGVEAVVQQLTIDHSKKLAGVIFYPLAGTSKKMVEMDEEDRAQIPVFDPSSASKTRNLDARYWQHEPGQPRETVVLFHGNGMTADDMGEWRDYYFDLGYDVCMPTMGGYPGSDRVETCEESTYRDVEAVKLFLQRKGVKEVGYHGLSIGGSLAFQAATAKTAAKELTTKFVIADQTFTSAVEVARNVLGNVGMSAVAAIAGGGARAATPAGRAINLDGKGTVTETDGLDNRKKARLLAAQGVPLLVIESNQDILMGRDKNEEETFDSNLGEDLLRARWKTKDEMDSHRVVLNEGHCAFFGSHKEASDRVEGFLAKSMPPSTKKSTET